MESILGFFHFHEFLFLYSSALLDMMAERNVMLASGRCHKSGDYINMQRRWNWLFVLLLVLTTGEV